MNISLYFALAIVTAFLSLYLKQVKPEYALCVSLCGVIFMLSGIVPRVLVLMQEIESFVMIDTNYLEPVLKIIGLSYLTQFSSDICKDAGENSLSNQVMTIGKITVLFIAMPIIKDVLRLISSLLEN